MLLRSLTSDTHNQHIRTRTEHTHTMVMSMHLVRQRDT